MTWSSGLAAASKSYTDSWKGDSGLTSLTTSNGTTTTSRAAAQGTVNGAIVETAFYYTTFAVDSMDMMRLLLANDGASNVMLDALFNGTTYTTIGMSYASADGCNMAVKTDSQNATQCSMVFDIVVAAAFTDASTVT